jgi:muramoyltetrapeptide carboxypeptidase
MKPPKLHPGDTVAIISPSNTITDTRDVAEKAKAAFEKATGLKAIWSPNAFGSHYYSAGTARQRLEDFHWALLEPEIRGIIFSVGGNTAVELVTGLDYDLIRNNPKVIVGISDATTLLNPITAKTGLVTFLGLEFLDFAIEPMAYEVASMKQAWLTGEMGKIQPNKDWRDFDDLPTSYKGWTTIKKGKATGKIVGGNFSSFAQLYHTEYMPSVEGAIIFMETYKEHKKGIHQALAALRLWGAFDKISGLVIGYCVGSDDPEKPGNDRAMADIVREATEGYDFPVMQIGEVGHNVENIMLPIGARAELDATNKTFTILESVAE